MKLEQTILPGTHTWAMEDNVPKEFIVHAVHILIAHDLRMTVSYYLSSPVVQVGDYRVTETIYFTKQHLLNSL